MLTSKNLRLISAAIISLSFHVAIMSTDLGMHGSRQEFAPQARKISLSLTARRRASAPPPLTPQQEIAQPVMPIINKIVREIPAPIPVEQPTPKISPQAKPTPSPQMISPVMEGKITAEATEIGQHDRRPIIEAKPLYRENPPPEYPTSARRHRYQGTVVLEVLVNENGRVDEQKIFTSSGHLVLDQAALRAVKSWLFQPASRDGKTLTMWVRVPVRFILK